MKFNKTIRLGEPIGRVFAALRIAPVVLLISTFGFVVSSPGASAVAPTCAEGGVCVVGDTGPGGGKVFFVKPTSGGFTDSGTFTQFDSMCSFDPSSCRTSTISISLTASEVTALPFTYLEVSPSSAELDHSWASTAPGSLTSVNNTAIGTGLANTDALIASMPGDTVSNNVGKWVKQLNIGGKNDWYIPSIEEFELIFLIQSRSNNLGTFGATDSNYITSTFASGTSMGIYFSQTRYQRLYVTIDSTIQNLHRPIRAFNVTPVPTTTTAAPSTTTVAPTATTPGTTSTTISVGQSALPTIAPTTTVKAGKTVTSNVLKTTTTIASTTTITTTTVAKSPTPDAPEVKPGEAGLIVDGKTDSVSLKRDNNSLIIDGAGISATIYGQSVTGEKTALDGDGNLRVQSSDKVVVEGSGYASGTEVQVWMYSTPSQLGVITAASMGKVKQTFALPTDLETGDHRVVLVGKNAANQNVTLGIGISYGEVDGSSLATRLLIIVPVALAILIGLLVPATRRRRRNAVPA